MQSHLCKASILELEHMLMLHKHMLLNKEFGPHLIEHIKKSIEGVCQNSVKQKPFLGQGGVTHLSWQR